MLKELFSSNQRNPDGTYNEKVIFENQIITLRYHGLITDDNLQEFEKQFIKRQSELHTQCMITEQGIIPFMFCPNPHMYLLKDLMDEIDIGGKPDWNTLFLEQSEMNDIWNNYENLSLSHSFSHIACGIQVGVTCDNPFQLQESSGIEKAPAKILGKIQNQPSSDITGLTFYEGLLLSLYYPDIYDVWAGIQTAGTVYGKDEQSLRLYWLNDKPNRFLKVAKEKSPLLDSRFISPRIQKRIIIEK